LNHNNLFDPNSHRQFIEDLKNYFSPKFFDQRTITGVETKLPVFIIGMPRSGTTLVQQIAASHPSVFAAGELTGISNLVEKIESDDSHSAAYPFSLDNLADSEISEIAENYIHYLMQFGHDSKRILDKMPFNFLHLGLIYCLFPSAKIINCRRNLVDTGISCYFQNFVDDLHWSTDLGDIGKYITGYIDIMEHWENVLPIQILNLDYENLVQEPEIQTRSIIEFLELDWDVNCLNFFEGKSFVTTASSWQVREPVYASAINRWRKYENHLGPLLDELGGLF
jgi:hypothetical protein